MKPAFVVLKYSTIMFLGFMEEWRLMELSPFNIPRYIPITAITPRISVTGFFIVAVIVTVLIFAQKELLRWKSTFNVINLTLYGGLIGLLAESAFQCFRIIYEADSWSGYPVKVMLLSLYIAVVSFLVAFQIKTRKTGYLILLILAFGMLIQFTYFLFPSLKK